MSCEVIDRKRDQHQCFAFFILVGTPSGESRACLMHAYTFGRIAPKQPHITPRRCVRPSPDRSTPSRAACMGYRRPRVWHALPVPADRFPWCLDHDSKRSLDGRTAIQSLVLVPEQREKVSWGSGQLLEAAHPSLGLSSFKPWNSRENAHVRVYSTAVEGRHG